MIRNNYITAGKSNIVTTAKHFSTYDGILVENILDLKQLLTPITSNSLRRNGQAFWPLRSHDLTPANSYMWGQLQGSIYSKRETCGLRFQR
jgi:hypothetical protein